MALPTNIRNLASETPRQESTQASNEVKKIIGRPFEKGAPQTRKASSRAQITEVDAHYLAYLSAFPAADLEAMSMLRYASKSPFSAGGTLPGLESIRARMRKLERLGAVERYRNMATGITSYGATKQGRECAAIYGYDTTGGRGINGLSLERLNHFRIIAHVAAQFASPVGYFEESIGISGRSLSSLVGEQKMRAVFEPLKKQLKAEGRSFGKWRQSELNRVYKSVQDRQLHPAQIVEQNPILLTLGEPVREGSDLKSVHQPDLAVLADEQRTGVRSNNLMVEIELSRKSPAEYASILRTAKIAMDQGFVYDRMVYFTLGKSVGNLLRQTDTSLELGLFESGKLTVLPILHRDGSNLTMNRRVVVGA